MELKLTKINGKAMGQQIYIFNCNIYRCLTVISKILISANFNLLDII